MEEVKEGRESPGPSRLSPTSPKSIVEQKEMETKKKANPWDSLMICGFSWGEAKTLVWAYAKKEGIKMPRVGPLTQRRKWWK